MNLVLFLGILLVLGLASTRVVKLAKLPNVTGYLVVGLIAAVLCIIIDNYSNTNLTYDLNRMNEFISMIALGFIALSIGEQFKIAKLKEYGSKIVLITFLQAFMAVVLVDVSLVLACVFLNLNVSIAICLGAIATATAPAATLMVINQYKANGPIVNILLPVVAFDDAIGLIVFAISLGVGKVFVSDAPINVQSLLVVPLIEIVGSIVVGFALGWLMNIVIKFFKSRNNHAITIIAFTLLGVGTCELLNLIKINGENLEFSNLLCCMMIGAVYINFAKVETQPIVTRDFDLIDHWTPFLFMLFFVLSGTHLATSAYQIITNGENSNIIVPVIIVFVIYIVTRSLGKYFGAFLGCKITKREKSVTDYLGITLLPQAGVAIGMANQISGIEAFQSNNIGNIIVTVVLGATLIYELVGPLLTKWVLVKTGEINTLS